MRPAKITSKPEIPERAKNEAALILHHQTVNLVKKYQIPSSILLNIDQTFLKYASVSNQTMAKNGSKYIAIVHHNCNIWNNIRRPFLTIELIYGGKNLQSLPRFEFPKAFPLSANEKYFSNTKESLKFLDEFIIPYVTSECKRKELDVNHPALLLMDVFRGQMTDPVLSKLRENSIFLFRVPPNMTNLFQLLDLNVNGAAKAFLKRKYIEWYSGEISKALADGIALDEAFSTETSPS